MSPLSGQPKLLFGSVGAGRVLVGGLLGGEPDGLSGAGLHARIHPCSSKRLLSPAGKGQLGRSQHHDETCLQMGISPAVERHRMLEGLEAREVIRGGFMEEAMINLSLGK